jgi:hypothetical protein
MMRLCRQSSVLTTLRPRAACTAYCLGRRRAARDRHVQLQEFNRS